MDETYTEFVADGQTALRVQREYMDIYIYTNMPGAAVCPCVSGETRDRVPRSAAPGHCRCPPPQFLLTARSRYKSHKDRSLRVRGAVLHSVITQYGAVGETDRR